MSLSLTIECFDLAEDTARPPCPRTSLSPTASTSLGRPQISGKKVIVPLSAVAPLCECYFPLYFFFEGRKHSLSFLRAASRCPPLHNGLPLNGALVRPSSLPPTQRSSSQLRKRERITPLKNRKKQKGTLRIFCPFITEIFDGVPLFVFGFPPPVRSLHAPPLHAPLHRSSGLRLSF